MAGEREEIYRPMAGQPEDPQEFASQVREGRQKWRSELSSDTGTGGAIVQELVKSYGFRKNSSGKWDWSLANIGKAFEEDPFWTTVDYLSLAVPILKWGTAARGIAKGAGAIGAAYKAGAFAGKTATTYTGRALGAITGNRALSAAAETYLKSGAAKPLTVALGEKLSAYGAGGESLVRGGARALGSGLEKGGRKLFSPGGNPLSQEFRELADQYGTDAWGKTVLARSHETERIVAETAVARKAQDLLGRVQKFSPDQQRLFSLAMRTGEGAEKVVAGLGDDVSAAFRDTLNFRTGLIDEARALGIADDAEALQAIKKGTPAIYEEIEKLRAQAKGYRAAGDARAAAETEAIMKRVSNESGANLTEIMNPAGDIGELARLGQAVTRQKFAQGIASSNLARTGSQVAQAAMEAVRSGDVEAALRLGIPAERLKAVQNLAEKVGDNVDGSALAHLLGWKKIKDLIPPGAKPTDMGFLTKLPEEMAEKFVDPAVADDLAGALGFYADKGRWAQMNQKILEHFRQVKTVLNPGTQVRNYLGMVVSSHLARGGMVKLAPKLGFKEWVEGGARYQRAIEAGIINSSTDEFRTFVTRGTGKLRDPGDYQFGLFGTKAEKWMGKGAAKADMAYAANDEVWKLDTWMELSDDLVKRGYTVEEAERMAVAEVSRYMPTYTNRSEFARGLSQAVPFSGFTAETVRTWKNTMTFKPHMAFLWSHMANGLSQTFGAMAGYSPQQLEAAKEGLPKEMRTDSSLVLPFNVDGKPQFLDLSYVIPGASWAGIADNQEGAFAGFFQEVANPLAHPAASIASVAITGRDTFRGKPVEPTLSQAAGIEIEGQTARHVASTVEHVARTMLPNWAGGYASQDLIEIVRGTKNPETGEDAEPSATRAALKFVGLKTMAPSVEAAAKRGMKDNAELGKQLEVNWDAWDRAEAQGDGDRMQQFEQRILEIQAMAGHPDPVAYVQKAMKRRMKALGSISKSERSQLLQKLGDLKLPMSDADRRLMNRLKRGE